MGQTVRGDQENELLAQMMPIPSGLDRLLPLHAVSGLHALSRPTDFRPGRITPEPQLVLVNLVYCALSFAVRSSTRYASSPR